MPAVWSSWERAILTSSFLLLSSALLTAKNLSLEHLVSVITPPKPKPFAGCGGGYAAEGDKARQLGVMKGDCLRCVGLLAEVDS